MQVQVGVVVAWDVGDIDVVPRDRTEQQYQITEASLYNLFPLLVYQQCRARSSLKVEVKADLHGRTRLPEEKNE
jgi:hypothetical protein